MEEEPPKVFLDYLAPFVIIMKIFGSHSMTLYRKRPKDRYFSVKVTFTDVFWLITSVIIYLYFIVKNMSMRLVFSVNDTTVSSVAVFLLFFGFIFQSAGCAVLNFFNRNKILKLFNKMLYVDKEARELGFIMDYDRFVKNRKRQLIISSVNSLFIWSMNITIFLLYNDVTDVVEVCLLIGSFFWIFIGYFLFVTNFIIILKLGLSRVCDLVHMVE